MSRDTMRLRGLFGPAAGYVENDPILSKSLVSSGAFAGPVQDAIGYMEEKGIDTTVQETEVIVVFPGYKTHRFFMVSKVGEWSKTLRVLLVQQWPNVFTENTVAAPTSFRFQKGRLSYHDFVVARSNGRVFVERRPISEVGCSWIKLMEQEQRLKSSEDEVYQQTKTAGLPDIPEMSQKALKVNKVAAKVYEFAVLNLNLDFTMSDTEVYYLPSENVLFENEEIISGELFDRDMSIPQFLETLRKHYQIKKQQDSVYILPGGFKVPELEFGEKGSGELFQIGRLIFYVDLRETLIVPDDD